MGEWGTPRLTPDQVIAILKKHGFVRISQSGSHQKWRDAASGKQVIVAYHRGKMLPLGTMKSIVEGSGIPLNEWRD